MTATFLALLGTAGAAHAVEGTWTPLPADSLIGAHNGYALLLTDGRILFKQENVSAVWSIYTPDAQGHYETGTWSKAASSNVARHYFTYAVLPDGRVFTGGGENVGGPDSQKKTIEWYDPIMDTWTQGQDFFGGGGDSPYQMLADGRILVGDSGNQFSDLWDFRTNTSSQVAGEMPPATVGEASWVLLPDGGVLDFSWAVPQKYLPSTGQWINVASPPVTLWDAANSEIGPGILLYTGKVFAIGGPGHTALYTPGAHLTDPGSWTAGPDLPPSSVSPTGLRYADDVAGCIEPNGKVLFVTSPHVFDGPLEFDEYDPATNQITRLVGPGVNPAPFWPRMLALPTGQILVTGTDTTEFLYTPVGGPNQAWRPTIQSVVAQGDGSYLLTGKQLNGLSQGGAYGDDGYAETNYPLVRFIDSQQNVRYGRTHDMSTMGVATGAASVSAKFNLPLGIPAGTYSLEVVANGIASARQNFVVSNSVNAVSSVYTSWQDPQAPIGYCTNVTVTNVGSGTIHSWQVDLRLGNAVWNGATWNATLSQQGSVLHAVNASYDGTLAPGGSVVFGFCAQATSTVPLPVVLSAAGS